MRIPNSFYLFGEKITVVIDDEDCKEHNCYGRTLPAENKIIIQGSNIPIDKQERVFWHEVIHYMFDNIKFKRFLKNKKDEELLADLLAKQFTQVINSFSFFEHDLSIFHNRNIVYDDIE